jgi:hypothetical protein
MDEAAVALPKASELRRFQAEPYFPEIVGVQLGLSPTGPSVYEYFDGDGRLFCIAIDAVRGPQVTLDGVELVGGSPAELEEWLFGLPTRWAPCPMGLVETRVSTTWVWSCEYRTPRTDC